MLINLKKLRLFKIASIFTFLLVILLFFLGGQLRYPLECIYTPPALNTENIGVYQRFINFVESHKSYRKIRLTYMGDIELKKYESTAEREFPSSDMESEIVKISYGMRKCGCVLALKNDFYIVFIPYPAINLCPRRPGVLYSIDGSNPNDVDSEYLNDFKPFFLIKDRWYLSRRLDANQFLRFRRKSLPNFSLIDHSLRYPSSLTEENI